LRELKKRLTPLEQTTCPFVTRPIGVGRAHWVKPKLVAEVTFSEWTADGRMRHPSFQGLREDKPATAVGRELPLSVAEAVATRPRSKKRNPARRREPHARRTALATRELPGS
jgi:bifunctional non-homologous end joining protein LigD